MAFPWRADDGPPLNAGLVALWILCGIRTSIAKNTYIFVIFQGEGVRTPCPHLWIRAYHNTPIPWYCEERKRHHDDSKITTEEKQPSLYSLAWRPQKQNGYSKSRTWQYTTYSWCTWWFLYFYCWKKSFRCYYISNKFILFSIERGLT